MMTDERLIQFEKMMSARVPLMRHEAMELLDEIKRLRAELDRYRTPHLDGVTFEPRPDEVSDVHRS